MTEEVAPDMSGQVEERSSILDEHSMSEQTSNELMDTSEPKTIDVQNEMSTIQCKSDVISNCPLDQCKTIPETKTENNQGGATLNAFVDDTDTNELNDACAVETTSDVTTLSGGIPELTAANNACSKIIDDSAVENDRTAATVCKDANVCSKTVDDPASGATENDCSKVGESEVGEDAEDGELLEDGELDDEPGAENDDSEVKSETEDGAIEFDAKGDIVPPVISQESDDQEPLKESTESSDSTDSDLEKKKKRKKEKHKKDRRKRKREKEKDSKRSSKKRRRHHHDEDESQYDNAPWGQQQGISMTSPQQQDYNMSPPFDRSFGGSPPPGPYDSPPYDSEEDDYSMSLFSMLNDDLMDPNVAISEKEALLVGQQKYGLSANKMKKLMKRKRWLDSQRQRSSGDRRMEKRDRDRPKCKFYAEGKCQKGERCPYSHNFIPSKKMEACKFFLQGYCAKGDMCVYLHGEIPCKYYHTGQKCFSADKCKFSHQPLSDSTRPLLEKALMWDNDGVDGERKARPSLLGTPPKNSANQHEAMSANHEPLLRNVTSIFDLDVKPTADLASRLDAGLYEEFIDNDFDDNERDQLLPKRKSSPKFYADTLSTPPRHKRTSDDAADCSDSVTGPFGDGPAAQRDLLARLKKQSVDNSKPVGLNVASLSGETRLDSTCISEGSNEDERNKEANSDRQPLLPNPKASQPSASAPSLAMLPPVGSRTGKPPNQGVTPQAAQSAVANLGIILNALRSSAAAQSMKTANPPADPRAANRPDARADTLADPRDSRVDPRADPRALISAGSRSQNADLLGSSPNDRHASVTVSSNADSRPGKSNDDVSIQHDSPASRPLEISGIPSHPMAFKLTPITIIKKRTYVPQGADTDSDMLKDPRIKKRLQVLKLEGPEPPPSLPDITADLLKASHMMQQQRSAPSTVLTPGLRRVSTDKQVLLGEQNNPRLLETPAYSTNKPHNRKNFYAINSCNDAENEEEDDDSQLTIDMPDDDSKTLKQVSNSSGSDAPVYS